MTNEQILNLDFIRAFNKTILEDIEREIKKIPMQYGSATSPKLLQAENVCQTILNVLRSELAEAIDRSKVSVNKYIETL